MFSLSPLQSVGFLMPVCVWSLRDTTPQSEQQPMVLRLTQSHEWHQLVLSCSMGYLTNICQDWTYFWAPHKWHYWLEKPICTTGAEGRNGGTADAGGSVHSTDSDVTAQEVTVPLAEGHSAALWGCCTPERSWHMKEGTHSLQLH